MRSTGRLVARCCQGIAPDAGVTKPLAGDDMTERAVPIKPAGLHDVGNFLFDAHQSFLSAKYGRPKRWRK